MRQALSYATPYQDIIAVGPLADLATQSRGPVSTGLYPHDDSLPQYTYDLEKAKQLLAQAGYPDGKGIPKLVLTYTSAALFHAKYLPLVKESWAKIGVEIDIQPLLSSTAKAQGPPEERQDVVANRNWPSYPDGYDMLWYEFHTQDEVSYNWTYWSSAQTDELMDTAYSLEASDPEKATQLFSECQRLIVEAAPQVMLFDLMDVYAGSPQVKLAPGALNTYYPNVLFWQEVSR